MRPGNVKYPWLNGCIRIENTEVDRCDSEKLNTSELKRYLLLLSARRWSVGKVDKETHQYEAT
jgi:hypothetical protein